MQSTLSPQHEMNTHPHFPPGIVTNGRARSLALIAVCLILAITLAPQAQAATVVSNLGNTSDGSLAVNNLTGPLGFAGVDAANSFTTGAAATLESVTLSLSGFGVVDFKVALYLDSAGLPGTSLVTLTGNSNPSSLGLYTYTGTYALAASTTYWVVASVPHDVAVNHLANWYSTTNPSETGQPGWSIGDGSAQRHWSSGVPEAWAGSDRALQFSAETMSVPEPGRATLLFGSVCLATVLRRRRVAH